MSKARYRASLRAQPSGERPAGALPQVVAHDVQSDHLVVVEVELDAGGGEGVLDLGPAVEVRTPVAVVAAAVLVEVAAVVGAAVDGEVRRCGWVGGVAAYAVGAVAEQVGRPDLAGQQA